MAREYFQKVEEKYHIPYFSKLMIMASNDINEETVLSLNEQGHCIDAFGIGTHLVRCFNEIKFSIKRQLYQFYVYTNNLYI